MFYKQFSKKLSQDITGVEVTDQLHSNGHLIEQTVDGTVLVDKEETEFKGVEEARQYIKTQYDTKTLEEEIKTEGNG